MEIKWQLIQFDELTPTELYQLLRLRSEVFVVEQQCIFLDMDNKDQQCWHLLGWHGQHLVAATRLVPPGISYDEMSIGRVVNAPGARKLGIGRALMKRSAEACYELWGEAPIRIGAQRYLESFYQSLGYEIAGEPYLEDGIPHVEMLKNRP